MTHPYDASGNILCQDQQNFNAQAFNYDAESQVIEAWRQQNNNTYALGFATAYDYNGLGERELKRDFAPNGKCALWEPCFDFED